VQYSKPKERLCSFYGYFIVLGLHCQLTDSFTIKEGSQLDKSYLKAIIMVVHDNRDITN